MINEELDRHKEALQVAIGALRELGLDYAHFTERVEKRIVAILEPTQEFEDATAEAWSVVDTASGKVWHIGTKEEMEVICAPHPTNLLKVVPLTGTYQRPVKRPVVKEVSVDAVIGGRGAQKAHLCHGDPGGLTHDCPFADYPECHGKTGKLIFQWTE